jgi:hypothetical protein
MHRNRSRTNIINNRLVMQSKAFEWSGCYRLSHFFLLLNVLSHGKPKFTTRTCFMYDCTQQTHTKDENAQLSLQSCCILSKRHAASLHACAIQTSTDKFPGSYWTFQFYSAHRTRREKIKKAVHIHIKVNIPPTIDISTPT